MIQAEQNYFALHAAHTTYAFCAGRTGHLFQLYYGPRVTVNEQAVKAWMPKYLQPNGCSVIADSEEPALCLDDALLEFSGRGKGDRKEPMLEFVQEDGSRTSDFRLTGFRVVPEACVPEGMPGAYEEPEKKAETLILSLTDRNSGAVLELFYSVWEDCDCITRFARLTNTTDQSLRLLRLQSLQFDLEAGALKVVSFHGDWAREMKKQETVLSAGKFVSESVCGFSSNGANPFVMFGRPETTETAGECFAMNLLYSGNHKESVEFGSFGNARVLCGIHPELLEWRLAPGEQFTTPQAVLTSSTTGYRGISEHMHAFVREHVVRGEWKHKARPVLLNSWEASYFDISERKLLRLAKAAKEDGMELFVLDDGWFGKRDNDQSSLGDWQDNPAKLPQGLAGLSKKIQALGLQFGIWVEPEMVSEDSELYRNHPDWAVRIPGKAHAIGRNQMLLDLSRTEIQDFLIETMSDVFARSEASYVKWDMNRNMSDLYSGTLPADRQGEFSHRYILGLYRVMKELTERFPKILFEGCASGGNRFDLGILSYFPQIWASDNSDAVSRAEIQNGYSYGYPQSVYTAHVSDCPNHQTLREEPWETRFAVAGAAVLGYECNLCDRSAEERREIRQQVERYKKWREVLQFGTLYRMTEPSEHSTALIKWTILAKDRSRAVGILVQNRAEANDPHECFRTYGLEEDREYRFYQTFFRYDIHCMGGLINTMAPFHVKPDSLTHDLIAKFVKLDGEREEYTVTGALLNQKGIRLMPAFSGTGYAPNTRLWRDYDARIYYMEQTENGV